MRTYNGGFSQVALELGIPFDASTPVVRAGSVVTATVEYLIPPAGKGAYYGASNWLTEMPADHNQGRETMLTLAADNQLEVETFTGTLRRTHSVDLDAAPGMTAAHFMLTGGLGYTPVTIHGVARPDGWRLEQAVDGT